MVELKKSKRIKPKEKYEISKTGRVKRDTKIISPAYERKYSHKIVQSYSIGKGGRLHGKRGRFQSNIVKEKYDKLIKTSRKRTSKRTESTKVTTTKKVTKGRFMKGTYAFTYECTCYIEEGISTHEDDKYGHTVTHYYTISSNEELTLNQAKQEHDRHYPTHSLLDIRHSSTKVIGF